MTQHSLRWTIVRRLKTKAWQAALAALRLLHAPLPSIALLLQFVPSILPSFDAAPLLFVASTPSLD